MDKEQIMQARELFQIIVRRMGFLQKEGVQCCGTTLAQSYIIYEIGKCQGISLNDLADRLGLDKSTMSRHVQALVKNGYMISKPDEEDRRFLTLHLTTTGTETMERISHQMTEYVREIFKQIPEEKRSHVLESMEILSTAICKSAACCNFPL
ncbi:MAG: MarR family winged helix-turn-helix transcriptional regulator [Bacillota bacterium]